MSDASLKIESQLIALIAKSYQSLNNLYLRLDDKANIIFVQRRMESWIDGDESILSMYVKAETTAGNVIYWRLLLRFSEAMCVIIPEVFKDYKFGEYPLVLLGETMSYNIADFSESTEKACFLLLNYWNIFEDL